MICFWRNDYNLHHAVQKIITKDQHALINGILRSGGDNSFCLMSDTFSQWGVGLMLTAIAIFVFDVSLITAFCIALSEEVFKAMLCFWRMKQKKWLRNLTSEPMVETN